MEEIQAQTFSYSVVQKQEPQTLGYALQVHSRLLHPTCCVLASKQHSLDCLLTAVASGCNALRTQDSPVGLAAWIAEKFRNWTDCNGDLDSVVSKDELLTNISIYWCGHYSLSVV